MADYVRKLPHFHPDQAYLFVTWRLHGSLPAAQPDIVYPTTGHAFAAQDRAMHRSTGPKWLADSRVAALVARTILDGESKGFYELSAWVVMPNHVHVLLLPKLPLSQITKWIKGRTSGWRTCCWGAQGRLSGSRNPTITG
ncbi:MAG TPA: transposase [Candidatus Sulfopaludibacter sp.]|jgi:putative DNA methylase|nr:transposase [Candidatus Sulfopaludibacter sp.]